MWVLVLAEDVPTRVKLEVMADEMEEQRDATSSLSDKGKNVLRMLQSMIAAQSDAEAAGGEGSRGGS